jgi:predicted outer membrane protein
MKKVRILAIAALLAVPMQLAAQAGTKNPRESAGAKTPGNETTTQPTKAQKKFEQQTLAKLHLINQHEIDAGNFAQERAQSDQVKNYGGTLVTDHQQLDRNITSFAERNDMMVPNAGDGSNAQLDKMQQKNEAMSERLKGLSGAQFDRAFATAMVQGHQQAVQLVRNALSQAQDAQFKSLLTDTLPVLQKHLQLAQQLQSQTAGRTSSGASTDH